MGLYFRAVDWFAITTGGWWEDVWVWDSEGMEVRSRARGEVITVPKGEKESGVSGTAVMRQLGVDESFGGGAIIGKVVVFVQLKPLFICISSGFIDFVVALRWSPSSCLYLHLSIRDVCSVCQQSRLHRIHDFHHGPK